MEAARAAIPAVARAGVVVEHPLAGPAPALANTPDVIPHTSESQKAFVHFMRASFLG